MSKKETARIHANLVKGENDGYEAALRKLDAVSSVDKTAAQIRSEHRRRALEKAYRIGEIEGYDKASREIELPIMSEGGLKQDIADMREKAMRKGEAAAYRRAIRQFGTITPNFPSESPTLFFKDNPSSPYTAYQMLHGFVSMAGKGQFIAQNWQTVLEKIELAVSMSEDLTWDAFSNAATTLAFFLEEYEQDIAGDSLQGVDATIYRIYNAWPNEWAVVRLGAIAFDYDEQGRPIPLTKDGKPASSWTIQPNDSRSSKMPKLSELFIRYPDTGEYAFPDKDEREEIPDPDNPDDTKPFIIPGRGRVEYIIGALREIEQRLQRVEKEVEGRAEIYEQLIDMRRDIDLIREIIDPKKLKDDAEIPPLDTLVRIRDRMEDMVDNEYFPSALVPMLQEIIDAMNSTDIMRLASASGWRHGFESFFRRIDAREERKMIRALKQIEKNYGIIWKAVHSGRVINVRG